MIKTHMGTGLKYLCVTQTEGAAFDRYQGSGVYWKRHLKEHSPKIIETKIIYQDENLDRFSAVCMEISMLYDVVNSDKWANLMHEDGRDGSTPGRKLSEEARKKISMKGKGKPKSEDTKRKMSTWQSGKKRGPLSDEHKMKLSKAGSQRKLTEEHRFKIGLANKSRIVSEETKRKLSKRIITDEWREKMSRSAKNRWNKNG